MSGRVSRHEYFRIYHKLHNRMLRRGKIDLKFLKRQIHEEIAERKPVRPTQNIDIKILKKQITEEIHNRHLLESESRRIKPTQNVDLSIHERPQSETPVKTTGDKEPIEDTDIYEYIKQKGDIKDRPELTEEQYDRLPIELKKRPDTSFYVEPDICAKCGRMKPNCICDVKDEQVYRF